MSTISCGKTTGAGHFTDIASHAWMILTFRHRGAGLDLGGAHMLLLGIVASLVAGVTALLPVAGDQVEFLAFWQAALVTGIAISVFYVVLGRRSAAAMIALILFTAPVELALLLLFESPHLFILLIKLWLFSAQAVFVLRADRVAVSCQ